MQGAFQTLVGGTASEIGGGKFANGAVSAAVVYLFNDSAGSTYPSEDEMIDGSGLKYNTWNPLKTGGDFIDGVKSIGTALYSFGDFLGRISGFRDYQYGYKVGVWELEAKLEVLAVEYAVKHHAGDIAKAIWVDMKKRPAYYLGGAAVGPTMTAFGVGTKITASTASAVFVGHKVGTVANYVHTEINPFH